MKFKVVKVREGLMGQAYVDVKYGDGREGTFGMDSKDDLIMSAARHYRYIIECEKRAQEAMRHVRQFEGKEFEF